LNLYVKKNNFKWTDLKCRPILSSYTNTCTHICIYAYIWSCANTHTHTHTHKNNVTL